ncbi:Nucleosomal histone H3-Lys79 methylase [Massospora cicadina]|nr:Nucleosomal histone H3-Lys79 methylase [Massospora cicadina]
MSSNLGSRNPFGHAKCKLPTDGEFFLVTSFTEISGGTEPDTEEYSPIHDIMETVSTVALLATEPFDRERFGDENNGIFRKLLHAIREYNALVREIRNRDGFRKNKLPRYEVLEHILYQCYARVVSPDAEHLTNYRAFSNQVYGEVNYSLVDRFIKLAGIDKDTLFIDMGCGIGNVVLQVAGRTGCRSVGIEIMELPAMLSKYQQLESMPAISFVNGDFLTQPDILELLPKADVLLINNYVFDSNLNLKIMDLFLKLKDGCRIISLKSFAPLDVKVNSRNAGDPESIMRIKRYEYGSDSVSWTANPGQFYIHTIDRGPLRRFLENKCTN